MYDDQCWTNKATAVDVDARYRPFFENYAEVSELTHSLPIDTMSYFHAFLENMYSLGLLTLNVACCDDSVRCRVFDIIHISEQVQDTVKFEAVGMHVMKVHGGE